MMDVEQSWGDEEMYYDLSVSPIRGNDTFKAEAAIKIQDAFAVQQIHVIQGWNGKTFVGMPQRENRQKQEKEDKFEYRSHLLPFRFGHLENQQADRKHDRQYPCVIGQHARNGPEDKKQQLRHAAQPVNPCILRRISKKSSHWLSPLFQNK